MTPPEKERVKEENNVKQRMWRTSQTETQDNAVLLYMSYTTRNKHLRINNCANNTPKTHVRLPT